MADDVELIKDTEGKVTYIFPLLVGESEKQIEKKMDTGYSELPQFEGKESKKYGYSCSTCEYMQKSDKSPTGYVCKKNGYFDAPHGCCDGYELKPELREYEE